jgi:2-methylcitrate dehydratase
MTGLGAAVGSALLLGCTREALEHAVGLATTMAVPTRATRAGTLSMWKGAATAASARFGVFAAQLAADGMTAPDRAIEGKDGLWRQVTGPFEVCPFGGNEPWMVQVTAIKQYPVEYNAQIAVEIVRALRRKEGLRAGDVAGVSVDTYWTSYDEIGNEPEKWAPTTRETADHSLPYLLATALVHGEVTPDSFDEAHLHDPEVRALMKTVSVHEDPEFTARRPAAMPCRLTVTTHDGRILAEERDQPLGHHDRPLPQSAVDDKFLGLTVPLLRRQRAERALRRLRSVNTMADAAEILDCPPPPDRVPGPGARDPRGGTNGSLRSFRSPSAARQEPVVRRKAGVLPGVSSSPTTV